MPRLHPVRGGPAVGSANTKLQRMGMVKLHWLVVRDFSLMESATW
jgi:formate dehydrogenase major subunit